VTRARLAGTRLALAAAVLAGAACSGEEPRPAPAPFELRDVVSSAVARLEAELERQAAPDEPDAPPPDEAELAEEVRGLVGFLVSAQGALREAALEDVRSLGEAAVAPLALLLDDARLPSQERQAAAELLGALEGERAASQLLARVEDAAEPWLRSHCAWRLGASGQDWVVPRLVLRLRDNYETDHETWLWIADALFRLGNFAGLAGVRYMAANGPGEALRARALARLEELGAEYGLDDLALQRLWDEGGTSADGRFPPPGPQSARYRLEVWRWIGRLDEFQLRGVDDARFILSRLGSGAVHALAEALHDASPYVRVHAAQCLERMGPRAAGAAPELVRALDRPDLAPQAAAALGAIGFPAAEGELGRRTEPPHPYELRLAAARALGRTGLASSRTFLRPLLDAAEPDELRQAAAAGLVYCGAPEEGVPLLLELVRSESVDPGKCVEAVRWWLARRAEAGSERAAALEEAWARAQPPAGTFEPADARRERLASWAERVRAALGEPGDGGLGEPGGGGLGEAGG